MPTAGACGYVCLCTHTGSARAVPRQRLEANFHQEAEGQFLWESSSKPQYAKINVYTMFSQKSPSIFCFYSTNVSRRSSGLFRDTPKMSQNVGLPSVKQGGR